MKKIRDPKKVGGKRPDVKTTRTRIMYRSQEEVDRVLNWAADAADKGVNHFPGMTYEQGVENGIRWVIGDNNDAPDAE